MFATKRRSEILKIVKDRQSISVAELISMFDESAATIRKDLTHLANSSLVTRTRGEVHIVKDAMPSAIVTPFDIRSSLCHTEKQAIAAAALAQIQDSDTIILDSGTTTYELACLLNQRYSLSVVTNSLPAAQAVSTTSNSIFLTGGIIFSHNSSTQGPEAEQYLSKISMDKAFISTTAAGVNGLFVSSPYEESIKRKFIKAAHTVYLLLDHAKFEKRSMYLFADYTDIDYIITDRPITDPELLQRLEQCGTQVIVAE